MTMVERVGEGLARQLNRRTMLKRAAAAIFGAAAAWSVEGVKGQSELAGYCAYVTAGDCTCHPPYGLYCGRMDRSYCPGAACSGGCYYDESYPYVGACWCSATFHYPTQYEGYYLIGYYQCCDCKCYGQQCACRQFIQTG